MLTESFIDTFSLKLSLLGKAAKEAEQQLRRQRRLMRTHVLKHMVIGARVVRGLDWKWRDQDGAQGAEGI